MAKIIRCPRVHHKNVMGQSKVARSRTLALAIVAPLMLAISARMVNARTYTVNTLDDTSGNGNCSLRDSINAANGTPRTGSTCTKAGSGRDTIRFSVTGTISLASTLPQVTDNQLTIKGPASPRITVFGGATTNFQAAVQVMRVASGATLNIMNLTITGGGGSSGGAIYSQGKLTVTKSTFANNNAGEGGGAIWNDGTLSVIGSIVSNNGSGFSGGGGILNDGTLTVTNSTFSGNSTPGVGGGIGNEGTLTVIASTFSNNYSTPGFQGGGIFNQGTLIVTNSTFFGNIATLHFGGGHGGGICNEGTLTVTNSTFSENSAAGFVVAGGQGGGIFGSATLKNTILAGNTSGLHASALVPDNCFGTITDAGYNISDDSTCGFAKTGTTNNGDGINPLLSTAGLANNGGLTQTIALDSESPAIDAIPLANCTDQTSSPNRIITDQRGALRPDAGEVTCDVGAYEFQDLVGQSNCLGKSVSALIHQFGNMKVAASALGFSSVQALQNAIRISCGG